MKFKLRMLFLGPNLVMRTPMWGQIPSHTLPFFGSLCTCFSLPVTSWEGWLWLNTAFRYHQHPLQTLPIFHCNTITQKHLQLSWIYSLPTCKTDAKDVLASPRLCSPWFISSQQPIGHKFNIAVKELRWISHLRSLSHRQDWSLRLKAIVTEAEKWQITGLPAFMLSLS